jgi:hypothetical protein
VTSLATGRDRRPLVNWTDRLAPTARGSRRAHGGAPQGSSAGGAGGGALAAGAPAVNIATNDFSARGGDQYPFRGAPFVTFPGVTYQQALSRFIQENLGGVITAADYPEGGEGRITTPSADPNPEVGKTAGGSGERPSAWLQVSSGHWAAASTERCAVQ